MYEKIKINKIEVLNASLDDEVYFLMCCSTSPSCFTNDFDFFYKKKSKLWTNPRIF